MSAESAASRPRGQFEVGPASGPGHPPDVSVVIAAHNAAATLPEQLDALTHRAPSVSFEIVVVDNNSTDGTAGLLMAAADRWPQVRIVEAHAGRGPAYARNVGAAAARADKLAFCDADDIVGPDWLAALAAALDRSEFACGPLEYASINPAWLAPVRGTTGADAVATFEGRFPFASSANLAIDRQRFRAIGGFDEGLRIGEDIDLSMRLHLQGVELEFVPAAVVAYRLRPSARDQFRQAIDYGAARPVLAERWRARGGPAISRWRGARNWVWLVRHLGRLRTRDGRAAWLWVAGQRLGNLRGAWAVRRLYV